MDGAPLNRASLGLVVVALAPRGALDFSYGARVHNAGVPREWRGFCMTVGVTSAVLVGCVLAFGAEDKGWLSGLGNR